ncbi:MAG: hypothetical protein WAZ20_09565 [Methanothrix sp.]|jgi:hypothetical protein|uniref:hypothetical protein n=1 Tax=Methanothrix sp. TaxID=90426 RepID=UPI001BD37935|nr:hypothetical protein [Methanothrix sp.]
MGWKEQIADGLGVIIIAAWLILVYFLLINRGESELLWSRSMFVFGSVEAIAFAAAGYYFGKEVHRERADKAEARDQKHEADANKFKTNGWKLLNEITALTSMHASGFNLISSQTTRTGLLDTIQSANSKDIGAILSTPSLQSDLKRIIHDSKDYFT